MSWTWSDKPVGTVRVMWWCERCFACGAPYHPKYMKTGEKLGDIECVSDHKCNKRTLRKRERLLEHEFDDPENYCECDDLDCKFEYLDEIMLDME